MEALYREDMEKWNDAWFEVSVHLCSICHPFSALGVIYRIDGVLQIECYKCGQIIKEFKICSREHIEKEK